jgi:enoyl-[acyl-carrier-protein] reductase (NADH)
MYLERLLFLITGAFVFLCVGFALIIMASNPAKRPSDQIAAPPAEVADAAVFLASDLGRGVTGNVLFVDAGMQVMAY